jgi:tetratricopeptide (TPR) repeat protein
VERIEKLKTFIAGDPADLFSRHALAMELVKIGDFESAIAQLEKILSIDELQVGTYYHLGKTYEKISLFNKALEVYEKGILVARNLQKHHELRELMGALNFLKDELL